MKKFADTIRTAGLIANVDKPNARPLVRKVAAALRSQGLTVSADEATAHFTKLETSTFPTVRELARQMDMLLVFGGDGTMLCVARQVAGETTPMLGINVGGLGFLTGVPSPQIGRALNQIKSGDFAIEQQFLIEARGNTQGRKINQCALNDFVISRGSASRMIELEVSVDGEVVTCYRCDGLIVSTPTGSTAYSLSAGGAIVSPSAHIFALTPICPHTLSNRSLIVSSDSVVRVKVASERLETILTADGQVQTALTTGDVLEIRRSRRAVRLMRLGGNSFFATLRQKLHWSGTTG